MVMFHNVLEIQGRNMSYTRRDLFKAVGLGGFGLIAGATLEKVSAGEHQPDVPAPANAVPIPTWQHPEADKIEAFLTLTDGYPSVFGKFNHTEIVYPGDILTTTYYLNCGVKQVTLHRVYDVKQTCSVLGAAIQGIVVYNHIFSEKCFHHLANSEELVLNIEKTREYYDNPNSHSPSVDVHVKTPS